MSTPPPKIETARLILREWSLADVDRFAEIYSDPEVMKYVGDRRPRTREETYRRKERSLADYREHGFGMWAVVRKEDGRIIGRCGLQYLDDGEVEIGWLLERSAWGHGYAYEAARACIEYGLEELKLPRIVAVAMPDNTASVRLMEKLGMRLVGEGEYYGVKCVRYILEAAQHQLGG